MNSVTGSLKDKSRKMPLFIADLSFLFLTAHFEFETEILIHCTNIPYEHPQIFSEFFDTFKIDFFGGSIGST